MTLHPTIKRSAPFVLAVCVLMAIAGVSAGHEFFARFLPHAAPAPAPVVQPSAADREALAALAAPQPQTAEMDGQQALRINASLPFSNAPIEAARPFVLSGDAQDQANALDCMTAAIYYEAGYETTEGERAVAQVVLNRMRHPAYPKSICGVVYQGAPEAGCQFSFACDGSLAREPAPAAWARARAVATAALHGAVMAQVGEATHYHADFVAPYWAPRLAKVKQIGAHIFYRWPGTWGRPGAFMGRYSGRELPFSTATLIKAIAPETAAPVRDPTIRRADNDVGGLIVPGLGWTPSIPSPSDSSSAMERILAGQRAAAQAAAPTATALASPQGSEG